MKDRVVRFALLSALVLVVLVGCADSRQVNAAFAQTKVSWFVFDVEAPNGLRSLAGFEQAQKILWLPRPQAVVATDLEPTTDRGGAAAVSHLGLLLLEDVSGTLSVTRPGAQFPLASYQTDRVFVWNQKVFLTLSQDSPPVHPPASLAWWSAGQSRLALYPLPSQVREPDRQVVESTPPREGSSTLVLRWKLSDGTHRRFERSALTLDNGEEVALEAEGDSPKTDFDPSFSGARARLVERLGAEVAVMTSQGQGPRLVYSETGWVAVSATAEAPARLYRLPELGVAGRYTGALALQRGFVFTWETAFRGYVGAAGLVHVPFAVLAP